MILHIQIQLGCAFSTDFNLDFFLKVEAIQQKRTIAFINHFITHTASFLNRFSCVCEEKLEHLSNRIQNLEITLSLLETKVIGRYELLDRYLLLSYIIHVLHKVPIST